MLQKLRCHEKIRRCSEFRIETSMVHQATKQSGVWAFTTLFPLRYLVFLCSTVLCGTVLGADVDCTVVCSFTGSVLTACSGSLAPGDLFDCSSGKTSLTGIASGAFSNLAADLGGGGDFADISMSFAGHSGLKEIENGTFAGMAPNIWINTVDFGSSAIERIAGDGFSALNANYATPSQPRKNLNLVLDFSFLTSSRLEIGESAFKGVWFGHAGSLQLPDTVSHLGPAAFMGAAVPALTLTAPLLQNISEDCFRNMRFLQQGGTGYDWKLVDLFIGTSGGAILSGAFAGISAQDADTSKLGSLTLTVTGRINRIASHAFEGYVGRVSTTQNDAVALSMQLSAGKAAAPTALSATVEPLAFLNARFGGTVIFGTASGTSVHAQWHFANQSLACMQAGALESNQPFAGCEGYNVFPLPPVPPSGGGGGGDSDGKRSRQLQDINTPQVLSALELGSPDEGSSESTAFTTATFEGQVFYPVAHFQAVELGALNMTTFHSDMFSGLAVATVVQPDFPPSSAESIGRCNMAAPTRLPGWLTQGDSELQHTPLTLETHAFRGARLFCNMEFQIALPGNAAHSWSVRLMQGAFAGTLGPITTLHLIGVLNAMPGAFQAAAVSGRLTLAHTNTLSAADNVDPSLILQNDLLTGMQVDQLVVAVYAARAYAVPPFLFRHCAAQSIRLHVLNSNPVAGVHGSLALDGLRVNELSVEGVLSYVAPPAGSGVLPTPGTAYLRNITAGKLNIATAVPPTISLEDGCFSQIRTFDGFNMQQVSSVNPSQTVAQCPNEKAFVPAGSKPLLETVESNLGGIRLRYQQNFDIISFDKSGSGSSGSGSSGEGDIACTCLPGTLPQRFSDSRICVLCPAGLYCGPDGTFACPTGTYNQVGGAASMAECTPCAQGTYSDVQGSTSPVCTSCPVGTFNNATGASSVAQCLACPAGSYAQFTGSAECTPCPLGTFSTAAGARQCTPCPLNTYGAQEGGASAATACRACPTGSGTFSVGTTSPAGCIGSTQLANIQGPSSGPACTAGQSRALDGSCGPCPLGHACPAGVAVPCPAGKFNNRRGSTDLSVCELCPAGSFNPLEGQTSVACVPCPSGSASNAVGATDASTCVDCAAGTSALLSGSTQCSACPIGTYASAPGSRQCLPCPVNTFGSRQGAVSAAAGCFACPSGTNTAGQTGAASSAACRAEAAAPPASCASNQVRDPEDDTRCVDVVCGAGTVLQGAVCVGCAAGTFGDPGAGCVACPPGQLCPGGTFSAIVAPERVTQTSLQLQETQQSAQEIVPVQSETQVGSDGPDANLLIFTVTAALAILLPLFLLLVSSLCSKNTRNMLEWADTFTTDHGYSDGRPIVKKGTVLGGACTFCMATVILGFITASIVQFTTRNTLVSTRFDPAGTAISSPAAVTSDWTMDVAVMLEGVATSADCPAAASAVRFVGGRPGAGSSMENPDWQVQPTAKVYTVQPDPSIAPSSICSYRAVCNQCALQTTLRARMRFPFSAQSASWALKTVRATSEATEGLPLFSVARGSAGATSTQRLRSSAWTLSATREVLQDSRTGDEKFGYLLALSDQSTAYLDGAAAVSGFVPSITPVELNVDVQVAPAASVISVSELQTPLGFIAALGGLVGAVIGIFRFVYAESENKVQAFLVKVGWLRRQDQWQEGQQEGTDVLKPLPTAVHVGAAGYMYNPGAGGRGGGKVPPYGGKRAGQPVPSKAATGSSNAGSMSSSVLAAPPEDANGATVLVMDDAEPAFGGVHSNPVTLGASDSQSVMTDRSHL